MANWSNTDYPVYQLGMPQGGSWVELVNSQDTRYGGSGPANSGTLLANGGAYDGFTQSVTLKLPKMTFTVLAPMSFVGVTPPAPKPSALALSAPWPNPTRGSSALSFTLPTRGEVRLSVHDVTGYILDDRTMTGLKLQKLLYYSPAWSLVWDGEPIFGEILVHHLPPRRPTTPPVVFAVFLP